MLEKTIYNLVLNSLDGRDYSKFFVNELIKLITKDDILKLAKDELKKIEYYVIIELPEWDYWKTKKYNLTILVNKLENENDTLRN